MIYYNHGKGSEINQTVKQEYRRNKMLIRRKSLQVKLAKENLLGEDNGGHFGAR